MGYQEQGGGKPRLSCKPGCPHVHLGIYSQSTCTPQASILVYFFLQSGLPGPAPSGQCIGSFGSERAKGLHGPSCPWPPSLVLQAWTRPSLYCTALPSGAVTLRASSWGDLGDCVRTPFMSVVLLCVCSQHCVRESVVVSVPLPLPALDPLPLGIPTTD